MGNAGGSVAFMQGGHRFGVPQVEEIDRQRVRFGGTPQRGTERPTSDENPPAEFMHEVTHQ